MSVRSRFERELSPALREIGVSIKIPDCSRSHKPFDYVIGIPTEHGLRYAAVEAKKADGWSLSRSKWEPHQRDMLDYLSDIDSQSAWVAIGFLDLPKMKRGPNGKSISKRYKKEAFLMTWADYLCIEGDRSCKYADIIAMSSDSSLNWDKIPGRASNSWRVPKTHKILF